MEGWVKLYRKLSEKAFYKKDSEKVHLWIHLLIKATHESREEILGGKLYFCKQGEFTTGRKQLSEQTGISESKIERILTNFEKIEQQIKQLKTSTNRLISILNWGEYQIIEQQNEQRVNNDRTTTEQRVNTLQECKECKECKEEEEKVTPKKGVTAKYDFIDSLIYEFKESYEATHNSSYELIAIGKERKSMGVILKQFKTVRPGRSSEQTIKEIRAYFDLCNKIEDSWLNQNMSLSLLVSKFNEINTILRNGSKRKTNQPATSDRELAELTAKHFASNYKG
jgi:hypothetical protein